jgi:hypothetical protein
MRHRAQHAVPLRQKAFSHNSSGANIDPDTWLDNQGSYHDDKLHVVERFTRKGNVLHYEVTDEDPTMFAEPFHPKPVDIILGKAGQHVGQDYPCSEMDQSHYTNREFADGGSRAKA